MKTQRVTEGLSDMIDNCGSLAIIDLSGNNPSVSSGGTSAGFFGCALDNHRYVLYNIGVGSSAKEGGAGREGENDKTRGDVEIRRFGGGQEQR